MRMSLRWLRDYADLDAPVAVLVQTLIDSGTEVDAVEQQGQGVVVARILELDPVPESTRGVQLVRIDVGRTEAVRLLTAAANVRVGQLVPWAPPGTRLPGTDQPLGVRTMFGGRYESPGMLCSATELHLGDDADGIMVLDEGRPGQPLHGALHLDTLLEIEPTTNRPDCLCHLGIARELTAALAEPLRPPQTVVREHLFSATATSQRIGLTVDDPAGCPRFMAAVIEGVRVGPSPAWLQARLRAIGQRPINNVVDVTNFVLAELGQPLHAFDLERLAAVAGGGAAMRVRGGRDEPLECLDGVVRTLGADDLVVCAGEVAVSIAGVMGGRPTAVDEATHAVVLEAASWDPQRIRATSKRLGLRTDASTLYEKGLPDTLPPLALARAAALIAELGGGFVLRDPLDAHQRPLPPIVPIEISTPWVAQVLGAPVDSNEAATALARLGFAVEHDGAVLRITPPHFRRDVTIPEDVVEEIGRLLGYDRVPATLPGRRVPVTALATPPPAEDQVSDICVGAGYDEVITYAFTSPRVAQRVPGIGGARTPLPLRNPLSEEWSVMRTSVLPGVCEVVASNVRRSVREVAVFEIGRVFWTGERRGVALGTRAQDRALSRSRPLPAEPLVLALAAHTSADADQAARLLRGLQTLVERLGVELAGRPVVATPAPQPGLHPGRSAALHHGDTAVGLLGELDRATMEGLEVRGRMLVAELRLDLVIPAAPHLPAYAVPPRLPAVVQDLAVVVPAELAAGTALATVRSAGGALLEAAELYDEYRDVRLGPGHKGWTFRLTYRSAEHTLTGAQAQAAHEEVAAALIARHGAEVRH